MIDMINNAFINNLSRRVAMNAYQTPLSNIIHGVVGR